MPLPACCRSSDRDPTRPDITRGEGGAGRYWCAVLAALIAGPAAAADCPAGGAVYGLALPGDPAPVELRLEPAALPGVMELWLAIGPAGQAPVLRLMPIAPMGHGAVAAYAAPDPLPEDWQPEAEDTALRLTALEAGPDGRLAPYDNLFPAAADDPAPAALAIPGLAAELWYATNAGPSPVSLVDGLWYRAACGP